MRAMEEMTRRGLRINIDEYAIEIADEAKWKERMDMRYAKPKDETPRKRSPSPPRAAVNGTGRSYSRSPNNKKPPQRRVSQSPKKAVGDNQIQRQSQRVEIVDAGGSNAGLVSEAEDVLM